VRGFVRFAGSKEGLGVARACELIGCAPGEVLRMSQLERELSAALATELEISRWELLGEMLGG